MIKVTITHQSPSSRNKLQTTLVDPVTGTGVNGWAGIEVVSPGASVDVYVAPGQSVRVDELEEKPAEG